MPARIHTRINMREDVAIGVIFRDLFTLNFTDSDLSANRCIIKCCENPKKLASYEKKIKCIEIKIK